MPLIYTHDRLRAAVHTSSSYDEALRRLGRNPTPGTRRYLRTKLREYAIDTTHFSPQGIRHTESRLRELVAHSQSVAEVVRRLGISPVGGNQAHIGRRIAELRIDTSHFTGSAQVRRKAPRRNQLVLGSPTDGRTGGERLRRALLRHGVAERCATCHTGPEWNSRPLRLEVDHLNGEWWDNRPENLRLLCPNCHAVTDTYRGRKRRRK